MSTWLWIRPLSMAAWVRGRVVVLATWAGLEPSGYLSATARVPDTLHAMTAAGIISEKLYAAHGEERGGEHEV